jgi:hypothetical protein
LFLFRSEAKQKNRKQKLCHVCETDKFEVKIKLIEAKQSNKNMPFCTLSFEAKSLKRKEAKNIYIFPS